MSPRQVSAYSQEPAFSLADSFDSSLRQVTTSERKDAELYYLSLNPAFPPDQIGRKRWDALVDRQSASSHLFALPSFASF